MKLTRTAIVTALLATIGGCGPKEPKLDKVTLFIFDASWSCKHLREEFRRDFRNKLMTMEGTRVFVDLIGARRVPEYPVMFEMPVRKGPLSQYSEDFDRERNDVVSAADAEVVSLLGMYDKEQQSIEGNQRGASGSTDIVLTLSLVNLFKSNEFRDFKRKELYLFSDGVQQSTNMDVMSPSPGLDDLNHAVEILYRKGLVPDLAGVTVRVGGLAAGKGKGLSPEQILLIRRFWIAYFAKTHAQFNEADLDGSILE